jgi:DmsE family decaheme c-type cytochrome
MPQRHGKSCAVAEAGCAELRDVPSEALKAVALPISLGGRRAAILLRGRRWLGVGFALLGLVSARAAHAQTPDYVGDETCSGCHQDLQGPFHQTLHAKVSQVGGKGGALAGRACESCHGPGGAHVQAGGGRDVGGPNWLSFRADAGEDPARQNAVCLSCHEGGHRIYWEGSSHDQRRVTCVNCHSVMRNVSDRGLLAKANQIETCTQCHLLPRAQIWRNSHMPLRQGPATRGLGSEGFMDCTDCHNPHGTVSAKLIDAITVNDKCLSCHAEKRGPFLWEHAPVTENCLNCHAPHGSVNPSMLVVAPPRLCETCHVDTRHPAQAHDPQLRFVIWRSCMNCHSQVHGSNHPSGMTLTR